MGALEIISKASLLGRFLLPASDINITQRK
jgi:hypothetical protein